VLARGRSCTPPERARETHDRGPRVAVGARSTSARAGSAALAPAGRVSSRQRLDPVAHTSQAENVGELRMVGERRSQPLEVAGP